MKINEGYLSGDPPLCNGSMPLCGVPSFINAVSQMRRPIVGSVAPVVFETNLTQLGEDITHIEGTAEFIVHCAGYYEIFYIASVMAVNDQAVAALLTLDHNMIPGTYSEDSITRQHVTGSLGGLAVLHICTPSTIRLVNAAEHTVYASASLYCHRLF